MIIELIAILASGFLAVVATIIVLVAKVHGFASMEIEIVSRKSGDQLRVAKSKDGVIRSIEIVNPSADVQNILDV